MKNWYIVVMFCALLFGCAKSKAIINGINESQANEIIVYLASKNISAAKVAAPVSTTAAAGQTEKLWDIEVNQSQSLEAMAILNAVGLPRRHAQSLLDLFADTGLMTSDRQEQIRFQGGLELDLANMIRQMDGVVDVVVKLSIPPEQQIGVAPSEQPKPSAAVFVKHSGILDDPNAHLVTKIKRLVASSINELTFDNVTVVSDLSRFTSVHLPQKGDTMSQQPETVRIWSVEMTKDSTRHFRSLFALFCFLVVGFILILGFVIWKIYPLLKGEGLRKLFSLKEALTPIRQPVEETQPEEPVEQEPPEETPPI